MYQQFRKSKPNEEGESNGRDEETEVEQLQTAGEIEADRMNVVKKERYMRYRLTALVLLFFIVLAFVAAIMYNLNLTDQNPEAISKNFFEMFRN